MIQATDEDFQAICSCGRPLLRALGVANHFLSWNYRHALGSLSLTCHPCGTQWVLGGRVGGYGPPDLIRLEELGRIPHLRLTPLQRRLLDVSLVTEEVLWAQEAQAAAASAAAGDEEVKLGHLEAARLMREALQREKAQTLRAILDEHGIEGLPERLRIARTSDGQGAIYAVDRGEVRQRATASATEPQRFALLDLS